MSLPLTIRVKISSEGAGSIAITPVVVQEMKTEELVRSILSFTRKDAYRIRDILRRGSFVSGASRFRWDPFPVELEEASAYLSRYPDADPLLGFAWERVAIVQLAGHAMEREMTSKRRLLRRRSFWDALTTLSLEARYVDYSYKEGADLYRAELTKEQQAQLRKAADLLVYRALAAQIRSSSFSSIDLLAPRS